VTVRDTPKRSLISRKFSFNEDMLKASSQKDDSKASKSATIGASAGSKLLRSSSFSNMMSKDDSNTGTLVRKAA